MAGLLISGDGLCHDFPIGDVFDYDTTRVTHVDAEELLTEGHDADTGGSRESDVHHAAEELLVAVEEGIVEGDTGLICVQGLVVLLLEEVLIVLLEHEAHLSFDELGQALLHVGRDFTAVLTVTIGDGEEVTVLEATEVRHCNPSVLVLLVRVRGRLACLGGESELSHAIREHLSWIRRIIGVFLLLRRCLLTGLILVLSRICQDGLGLALPLIRLMLLGSLIVSNLGHHALRVLRLRVGLQIHRWVLRRQWHLLGLNLVRLLHHWSLI